MDAERDLGRRLVEEQRSQDLSLLSRHDYQQQHPPLQSILALPDPHTAPNHSETSSTNPPHQFPRYQQSPAPQPPAEDQDGLQRQNQWSMSPPPHPHSSHPQPMEATPAYVTQHTAGRVFEGIHGDTQSGTASTQTRVSSGNYTAHASSSPKDNLKMWEMRPPSSTLDHYQGERAVSDEGTRKEKRDGGGEDAREMYGDSRRSTMHLDAPLPALPKNGGDIPGVRRVRTMDARRSASLIKPRSGIDWIVPVEEKPIPRSRTVAERLQPTMDIARQTRDKFAKKARYTGYLLNTMIGLQVLLGSLTTGLSALATTGRQTAIQTTILGGMTTLIAGYLARSRGSNEPELSTARVKDLDKFIREGGAFILDFGHLDDPQYDARVNDFRREFEELLGNGSGERKLAPNV